MSDDNPHSANGSSGKSWAAKLLQIFTGEPKSREELVDLIQDAEERDLIDNDTKEMIEGVLDVAELKVRDIMIPRSQMVTIDVHQSVEEFLPIVIESQHSRYPVVTDNKDQVEGILLAKDLLSYGFNATDEEFSLDKVMRPAVIVPESKRVDVLLKDFRSNRYHMAIVVDEYGGVSGLVTIEDILEEIVGEIEDETDINENDDKQNIRRLSPTRYSVKALTTIEDFNEYFKSEFSDEEHDTVGGLIAHGFGHLPQAGEEITLGNFTFRITNADKRRIQQLQVSIQEVESSENAE
ncbi:magnesium/cobalt efflux protein [Idiomarina sp. WRN-38]|mgnify:CR=1 FL=1|jgi:magnesium and cobalt transporter|uniref:CNNM family magnesium/cobalt transport protein CorC n=1 Tax=unclassified Idiomarina TaxID=2614829 RepID=UPI0007336602|nr:MULTISPECIES: CNNM family magnesium/cobalt transport protein CorC [unclassified Idiomarina]KTG24017.1 magnesium/cobalt efflux protein [Idiomarina sp. H105]MBF38435.1 magnesium/cobalt transporter CorC [Idiomarinaceae bacterium]OAE91408.1 magnesium/cobalt efflux protein [Idiomarina sp. WRN-38]MCH2454499.1 CNNM family magnesium/cobalt transport protein CorC [Idiomarina sp.]MCJ8315715.1 CNNM family magnesium/cobalt transport protein CorC [Idiomarina sp.]|tara:strand:+ start:304 stop:1185 length:882 start_codon:yes stop_codon:yes gene_type:complete